MHDAGLIHCVHREYYPETGHFMQSDPLGYAAGNVEVYGWCLDDPVNLVDPLGLEGSQEGGADKVGVAVGAAGFGFKAEGGLYHAEDHAGQHAIGVEGKVGFSSDFDFSVAVTGEHTNGTVNQVEGAAKYVEQRVGNVGVSSSEGEGYVGKGGELSLGGGRFVVPTATGAGIEGAKHLLKWKESKVDTPTQKTIRERH